MTKEKISNINTLKEEAVHRAREMQKRARFDPPPANIHRPHEIPQDLKGDIMVCRDKPSQRHREKHKSLFPSLKFDEETLLILALIVLLIREKADKSIIFALLYLLL